MVSETYLTKLIIITGPTASKKSALAKSLQNVFSLPVLNFDRSQMYKDLTIGVNKDENFLFTSFLRLDEEFNIKAFQKLARRELAKHKAAILVGGSGLYLNAIIKNYFQETKNPKMLYPVLVYKLFPDRDKLYEEINTRFYKMLDKGFLDEVKMLKTMDVDFTKLKALGYLELNQVFDGILSLDEASKIILQKTRNYAKRQFTWFRHQIPGKEIDPNNFDKTKLLKEVEDFLNER